MYAQPHLGEERVRTEVLDSGIVMTVNHGVKHISDPEGLNRRVFEGWVSQNGIDWQNEETKAQAFFLALDEYLKKNPVLVWHHDPTKPIGRILKARPVLGKGVHILAEIFRSDDVHFDRWQDAGQEVDSGLRELCDDVWSMVKSGFVRGLSWKGDARQILRHDENTNTWYTENAAIKIHEMTLTPTQVHPNAQITGVNTTAKALGAEPAQSRANQGESSMSQNIDALKEQLQGLMTGLSQLEDGADLSALQGEFSTVAKAIGLPVVEQAPATGNEAPDQVKLMQEKFDQMQETVKGILQKLDTPAPRQTQAAHEPPSGSVAPPTQQPEMDGRVVIQKAMQKLNDKPELASKYGITTVDTIKTRSLTSGWFSSCRGPGQPPEMAPVSRGMLSFLDDVRAGNV